MKYKVDNAIIMAAGLSSRFVPISYEKPKALINVKGEVLIERQIRQLKEAGIVDIIIVCGYKKEAFTYLTEKFNVKIIENKEYLTRNNHASLYATKEYLKNSYICSADNYFKENPFTNENEESYYAAVYAQGETAEWCMEIDDADYIKNVTVGGNDSWIMLGHVFFSENFSKQFVKILEESYNNPMTKDKLWESIYIEHLNELSMKIKKYESSYIYEFDSLDELREFDSQYINHSNSIVMEEISRKLNCLEADIMKLDPLKDSSGNTDGMMFTCKGKKYWYKFREKELYEVNVNE